MAAPDRDPAQRRVDVIIVGGGASGVAAALQAARLGCEVLLIEETPWVGGMLTSAGVPALDGNDAIPSGVHREFVLALRNHYGGAEAVRTGWVSNTLYEPRVGQAILRGFLDAEPSLSLWTETRVARVLREGRRVAGVVTEDGREVRAPLTIDATEYGDVIALAGAPFRLGRESRAQTGESCAPEHPDNVIQDYTYCMILRDFGPGADRTVPRPPGYAPEKYVGSIREFTPDPDARPHTVHSWERMISYGRLPNDLYMINWPIRGNDFFAPELVTQSADERRRTYQRMKEHSLGFLHYIQTVAGHPELGIAEGEIPTPDGLPFIPYIRESRRLEAAVMLCLDDVVDRHARPERPLFKTGVAVGDYFIDHHHTATIDTDPLLTTERFPPIQAVTVPLGCLIPVDLDGLLGAEKSIGVTHAVNGVTRLQPIVMNIGQAAGALAALAVRQGREARAVDPRDVQQALLDAGALLMPFADVGPEHRAFQAIHRVAVAGVMRGFDQERRCEFRPEAVCSEEEIRAALRAATGDPAVPAERLGLSGRPTRADLAVAIDRVFAPFRSLPL